MLSMILLFMFVFVSLAHNGESLYKDMSSLIQRDKWYGIYVHDISTRIQDVLVDNVREGDNKGKIATLSPLFVVEANIPIYLELSTGPFLYRIGDLLTQEDRERFIGTSPNHIGELFEKEPPVAILVGFEGKLDQNLFEYAILNDYVHIDIAECKGDLYIRP